MICLERGNYYREVILSIQKSAEVILTRWNEVPFEVKDRLLTIRCQGQGKNSQKHHQAR